MISQLEKEITLKYLKTRKNDGFLNIISIFSFIGISLGVAVLIIVMSVMNGFRTELVEKIIGFNSHAVIKPYDKQIDENLFNNKELNYFDTILYNGTLFETELLRDNKNNWSLLLADIYMLYGEVVKGTIIIERINHMHSILQDQFIKTDFWNICPLSIKKYFDMKDLKYYR